MKSKRPSNNVFTRQELLGKIVRAPRKNGRGYWWLEVIEISDCGRFVKLKAGKMSGSSYWQKLNDCTRSKGWGDDQIKIVLI